ncbi:MAG: twin-arginine translocation signal domain-containing protein [Actinomycetota bacterium]
MSECVSRRRFLTLTGAGVATVAGSVALYGVQRFAAGESAPPAAAVPDPRRIVRQAQQRVAVETRYTPGGVPYLVAVALD